MTSTLRRIRTIVAAAAIVLYATVASPQSAATPQAHDDHDHAAAAAAPAQSGAPGMAGMPMTGMPMAGMPRDVMARVAALDDRIRMLATDMNMFVGELKIETMAALLTALVERQSLMRHEMSGMRDGMMMMHRMMQPRPPAATDGPSGSASGGAMHRTKPGSPAAAVPGEEPGTTCAPSP